MDDESRTLEQELTETESWAALLRVGDLLLWHQLCLKIDAIEKTPEQVRVGGMMASSEDRLDDARRATMILEPDDMVQFKRRRYEASFTGWTGAWRGLIAGCKWVELHRSAHLDVYRRGYALAVVFWDLGPDPYPRSPDDEFKQAVFMIIDKPSLGAFTVVDPKEAESLFKLEERDVEAHFG